MARGRSHDLSGGQAGVSATGIGVTIRGRGEALYRRVALLAHASFDREFSGDYAHNGQLVHLVSGVAQQILVFLVERGQIAILEVSDGTQHLGRFSVEHLLEGSETSSTTGEAEMLSASQ